MSNYTLNNVKRHNILINEDNYWDFHVNHDHLGNHGYWDCLSAFIDTNNDKCVSGNTLIGDENYIYPDACSFGLNLDNIGLTGVDNGFIPFRKDRVNNETFYKLYTQSKYSLPEDDLRLHLTAVSGSTLQYEYPMSINEDKSIKLNGGFYQGFFKSNNNYFILPSQLINGQWNLEFMLKKEDYNPESTKTINDSHPDNKGIFFYLGTRAENKWQILYNQIPLSGKTYGECEECEDDFDLIEDEVKIDDFDFQTNNGFDLDSANDGYIKSDNKFLMFDRTCTGITTTTYVGDEEMLLTYKKQKFESNLFLYMDRTCTGYTATDIENLTSASTTSYNSLYKDLYNNALGFFIDDNGAIGYKYLIKDCSETSEGHLKLLTGKSFDGIIKASQWTKIRVNMKASNTSMKLYFYVDDKLKYITQELPLLNLHELDEMPEKQEGVAFNISLGGGTLGLAETVMPDYELRPTQKFPLEENFAGTFIGDIKYFKFYTC